MVSIISFCLFVICISNETFSQPSGYSIEELENKILDLEENNIELSKSIYIAKKENRIKDATIMELKRVIATKNIYIDHLEKTLKSTEELAKKERLWKEQVIEMKSKDSMVYMLKIIDLEKDKNRLSGIIDDMQTTYKNEMRRLYEMIFTNSFLVTATLKDGVIIKRPNGRIKLDNQNNMLIKATTVISTYIEFRTGKTELELPDYTFSLTFKSHKNNLTYQLFENSPIECKNGIMNHYINFSESLIPYFNLKKGHYTLLLMYEEDLISQIKKYEFTLK